jgi:O-methyltransferase
VIRRVRTSVKGALLRALRPAPPEGWGAQLESLSAADRSIVERAIPYTMTGVPRLQALVEAVRYCVRREVRGAFAECGVWRGGSILAMIYTLQNLGVSDRDIYLYDTFEGMTEPTAEDVSPYDGSALRKWNPARRRRARAWHYFFDPKVFNEEAVRETVLATGYPPNRVHFVKGPVESTVPEHAPVRLALLRLDTDWYESTRHELMHLYPRLSSGGILIIDDYGHWQGARRAVDEYFAQGDGPLLNWIDYAARIAVKDREVI